MERGQQAACPGCRIRDAWIGELTDTVAALEERIRGLEETVRRQEQTVRRQEQTVRRQEQTIRELKAQLARNSSNSSRPPSSDPPENKPKKRRKPSGRKRGAQPGHPPQGRELLPPERVDETIDHKPSHCRRCGAPLKGEDPYPRRHQVTELPPIKPHVEEHRLHELVCSECGAATKAHLPEGVPEGAFGPRLQATVGILTGVLRLSKRAAELALENLFGVDISLGSIIACEKVVSEALREPYEEAKAYVQAQPVAHADETGWRQEGKRAWLWTAVSGVVAVFLVHARRSAKAAGELLGAFAGILVSDRWKAYNFFDPSKRQLCWAHLIRAFEGFVELGGQAARIGRALLAEADKMFQWWHRVRDGTLSRSSFRTYMAPVRRRVEALLERGARCRNSKVAGRCKDILKLAPALWTFLRVEGVEPTNNAAERALRPAVILRKTSYGTQSDAGSRFVERIMTATQTMRLQGRNVVEFVTEAVHAHLLGRPVPSLLPGASNNQVEAPAA